MGTIVWYPVPGAVTAPGMDKLALRFCLRHCQVTNTRHAFEKKQTDYGNASRPRISKRRYCDSPHILRQMASASRVLAPELRT